MWGDRTLPSMLGKRDYWFFLLLWTLLMECEVRGTYWNWKTLLRRSFQVHPHWFMVRIGGELGKWLWMPCSIVGRNVVVPFVFPRIGFRYVDLPLFIMNDYVFIRCHIKSELEWCPFFVWMIFLMHCIWLNQNCNNFHFLFVVKNICEGNPYTYIYIVVIRLLKCSHLSAKV